MSLDQQPDSNTSAEGILDRTPTIGFALHITSGIDLDAAVTQILENNLQDLSELRRDLERTSHKGIYDVRLHRPLPILEGFEGTVTYDYLLDIINELKDGIALRRVQLMKEAAEVQA